MAALSVVLAVLAPFAATAAPSLEAYFAPFDTHTYGGSSKYPTVQTDLELIDTVVAAKKAYDASGLRHPEGEHNPFVVQFCVYNLLDETFQQALIKAWRAGVYTQVMIEYKQLQQPYVHTYDIFKDAGLKVAKSKALSQLNLTDTEKRDLNLIGISVPGIMHMKLRYFSWLATPDASTATEVVVSGSLNPEDTATTNDDTLVVVRDDPTTVEAYRAAMYAVLGVGTVRNEYNPKQALNVFFSRATVANGTEKEAEAVNVLLDFVRSETEAILISVYSLRSLRDSEDDKLVTELCAAHERGVAVAVLVDKGQSDGEPGFAPPDNAVTAFRITQCGIPVYKCKNYNSKYSAMHSKNAVFGVKKRIIVSTDSANWSGASMGYGKSYEKPRNAETVMIIDSMLLDNGRTGKRYISNFLALLREYEYQQACPYIHAGKKITDQCASEEPNKQPDWVQPAAAKITGQLVRNVTERGWPVVDTTFTIDTSVKTMRYSIDGSNNLTAMVSPISSPGKPTVWGASLEIPFGSSVDVWFSDGRPGAPLIGQRGLIADAAYDWQAAPPRRRSDTVLDAMRITIAVKANLSSRTPAAVFV